MISTRTFLLGTTVALFAACTPMLAPTGTYSCANGGSCPAPQRFCHADGLCWSMPEFGPDAVTANTDAVVSAPDVVVVTMPDGMVAMMPDGMAAPSCPCVAEATCVGTQCLKNCTSATDTSCPTGSTCAAGAWAGTAATFVCAPNDHLTGNLGAACSGAAGCTAPFACIGGACVRPCPTASGPGTMVACGGGVDCKPLPPSVTGSGYMNACLPNCAAAGATCTGTNITCRTPPSGSNYTCFPAGWTL